uniref:Reverse transcriptase domain-containing protein n=1 Tax=Amphilophus citrinellus TaxID=61819 RepID=A0A3Q0RIP7_AMPCI
MMSYVRLEKDKGSYIGMALLDLQKAFATVDHSILIMKLEAIGLHESAIDWFASFLQNRQQCFKLGNTLSEPENITCGVPQGAILCLLLFLVYINDIASTILCKLLLYADGSALIVADKSPEAIQHRLAREMESIREWLIDNRFSLHLGKTETILYAAKRKFNKINSIQVLSELNRIIWKREVWILGFRIT